MNNKVYSFQDENGNSVKYTVKEYLSVNKNDYVLMSPQTNPSSVEIYRFSFENGDEALELVENQNELEAIKSNSKII